MGKTGMLRRVIRATIKRGLRLHNGHVSDTARWLGISRRALFNRLIEYGLDGEAASLRTEAGIQGPRGLLRMDAQ